MTSALRMALVGAGRMGRLHAAVLSRSEIVDLVAVADTRPEAAAEVAADCGAVAYPAIEQLFDADVEAWLIATPTPTHPELVELALRNDVHVLCEKPLSLDLYDHDSLGRLAADRDLVLQVGFWRRFSPPWARAKELIDAGAIGEPLMLRLSQWDANPPPPDFCDPAVSGGLAIDCGVHEYDLAEWLTGRGVTSVNARNLRIVDAAVSAAGDVDNLLAVLDLEGGAVATVDLSRNCRYGDDVRTEVLGAEGAILVDLLPMAGTRLGGPSGLSIVAGSEAADGTAAGLRAQASAFAASVGGAIVEHPGASDSRRALEIGHAIQRSAETGVTVTLSRS